MAPGCVAARQREKRERARAALGLLRPRGAEAAEPGGRDGAALGAGEERAQQRRAGGQQGGERARARLEREQQQLALGGARQRRRRVAARGDEARGRR